MTAPSLKNQIKGRMMTRIGGPPKRRKDRYSKPFQSKPKPEGYVFGRPTLYRPEYCERAIAFMSQGYSVTALAGHLGMSKDAVYDFVNRYPDFRHAIAMGRAARVQALEAKLLTTSQGVGVTAAIFALKNADPDEWQDRYQSEVRVSVAISQMSDAELMAIAASAKPMIEVRPVKAIEAD